MSVPFVASQYARASGVCSFLQPIPEISIDCMWCGKKDVHPHSRSQKTCGRQGCGEKQNKYRDQTVKAIRQGRVSVWMGVI